MAKKNDIVEVTGKSATPFRLFNKIEYVQVKVPEEWGDASFSIRPMTNTERALFACEEEEIKKRRDLKGAVKRNRLATEEAEKNNVSEEESELTKEEQKAKETRDLTQKMDDILSDTKTVMPAEEQFLGAVKAIILSCVESVTIGENTRDFDGSMFEEMRGDAIRLWLLSSVREAGEITDEEVLSL